MQGNGKASLTREQILAAIDQKIEAVDVPEWGGTVHVRNLTGKARDKYESTRYTLLDDGRGGKKVEMNHENTRASLLAATICDSEGHLQFNAGDIEALGEKNGAVLDRLFDVAQRLSGMKPAAVDEAIKN